MKSASALTKLDLPGQILVQIVSEMEQFLTKYPFRPSQVCLNDTGRSNSFDAYEGIGSLGDIKADKPALTNSDFIRWAPELAGGAISGLIEQLEKNGFKLGRTRFLNLRPKTCYSFHVDPTARIHLALRTCPQAVLIFPESEVVHIPADGHLYLADTTRIHSAMNGGQTDRIHLVMTLL